MPVKKLLLVPVDPAAEARTRRHEQIVAMILNSLIRQGVLVQDNSTEWALIPDVPQLVAGPPGQNGQNASNLLNGTVPPASIIGIPNDYYFQRNGDLWWKTSPFFGAPARWTKIASLVGPAGKDGKPGHDGQPGAPGQSIMSSGGGSGGTLDVPHGGTGATSLTAHGVLLGEGTSAITPTAAMVDGQLLVGQTSADPLPKTMSGDAALAASGALTIAADAVTYAKMQNVSAASKLLGRGDSGAGDPQEITLGTGLTMTGTTLEASGGGGGVTGSGTPGTLPIWTGSTALGDSHITESGGAVFIEPTSMNACLIGSGDGVTTYISCPSTNGYTTTTNIACFGVSAATATVNVGVQTGGTAANVTINIGTGVIANVAINIGSSGGAVVVIAGSKVTLGSSGQQLSFFGATPSSQQGANQALTDSTTGSASTTLASLALTDSTTGSAGTTLNDCTNLGLADPSKVNDNFATLAAYVNTIKNALASLAARNAEVRTLLVNYGLGS